MKETDLKLLNAVYQNIKMGVQSINDLLPVVKNEDLKSSLSKELDNYEVLAKECEMLAKAEKLDIKDNNWMEKSKLWLGIKMKTATNKTPQNIAEMLILGSQMGIIDVIKEKSKNKDVSDEIVEIAKKIENMQEDYIQVMKPFLEIEE